jgi:hypothetical protein
MSSSLLRHLPLAGVAFLCACSTHQADPLPPAQNLVDGYIQDSASRIALAQNEVAQLHRATLTPETSAHSSLPASSVSSHPALAASPAIRPPSPVTHAPGTYQNLCVLGNTDDTLTQLVSGNGKPVSLATAVHQILPPGWQMATGPGVSTSQTVHWSGTDQWPYALDKLLTTYHLTAVLDAGTRHAAVYRADRLPTGMATPAPAPATVPHNPFSGGA